MDQTRRDIEAEKRRALQEIRYAGRRPDRARHGEGHAQDADEDDQRRLVEEALGELDFEALAGGDGSRN